MEGNKHQIYKVEGMISTGSGNYIGILAVYDDRCLFYNDKCVFEDFEFDISSAKIVRDSCEVSFMNLYTKEKEFVQIECSKQRSLRYFLTKSRADILVGRFEQRKVEKQNYQIVIKALELGYTGETEEKQTCKTECSRKAAIDIHQKSPERKASDLHSWNDLLTPQPWRDYYQSLNLTGRKIYDTILEGIVEYKKTVHVDGIRLSNDVVGIIYHYILWDNPAIFCIGEYAMWNAVADDGRTINITSLCGEKECEQSLRTEVLMGVKKVLNNPSLYTWSDIQKEKYVHDYMIRNWTYDKTLGNDGERLEPYTIYGAFVQKTAVCEGFAKAAKLLLDLLGVHTLVVSGEIKSAAAGHAWNVVEIEKRAYHLDITFDMGQTGGRNYAIRYDYFNVPDSDLIDRTWQNPDVVWKCDAKEHTFPVIIGGVITEYEQVNGYIKKEISKRKAYMYIKFADKIQKKLDNPIAWICQRFESVKREMKSSAQATVIPTDIHGLYVIAINYKYR